MKKYFLKISLILFLLPKNIYSQQNTTKDFSLFSRYGSLGANITPLIYNKAVSNIKSGTVSLSTKPTLHYKFGITKRFFKDNQWSVISGLQAGIFPYENFEFVIKAFDYPGDEDLIVKERFVADVYFNLPVLVEFKKKLNSRIFFNASVGINVLWLTYTEDDLLYGLISPDQTTNIEVLLFEQKAKHRLNPTGQLSAGLYLLFEKMMLRINLEYNHSFYPIYEGRYKIGNLIVTPPTEGTYKNNANYFGLSTTVFFRKRNIKDVE